MDFRAIRARAGSYLYFNNSPKETRLHFTADFLQKNYNKPNDYPTNE